MAEQLFTSVDTDGSGSISKSEFSSFASRFSSDTGTSLLSAQEDSSDDLFTSLDGDGDGALSEAEMSAMQPPPPPPEGDMAEQMFNSLDSDGDGSITESELSSALSQAGSDTDASSLLSELDADGNGSIDESELASAIQPPPEESASSTTTASASSSSSGSSQSYDPLDTNKDGTVSAEERAAARGTQQATPTTGALSSSTLSSLLSSVQMAA